MQRSVAWRLVYVRRLLESAKSALRSTDPFAPAQAVSHAQDAVELVLALIAPDVGASVAEKDGFSTLLDKVAPRHRPAAIHSRDLHALNKLRVAAKHVGVCPPRVEAEHYVHAAQAACHEMLVSPPISIDLTTIRRASWLSNQLAAEPLCQAESMLECWTEDQSEPFAIALATAVYFAERQADVEAAPLNRAQKVPLHALQQARDFPGRSAVTKVVKTLEERLADVEEAVADLSIGKPLHELKMLNRLLPRVSFAETGKMYSVQSTHTSFDPERARALYETVLRVTEHAASVEPRTALGRCVIALSPAEAWFGSGESRRRAGAIQVGRRYSFLGAHGDGNVQIRLFGVEVAVPADVVETTRYGD